MRPIRLELEGFASFLARAVIDFDDADLFAFTGPTGAGKSSLIDAITFALYGSVPRYGNRNLVEPAISKGANEARVRLDFQVDGETYTAVRVVRRTASGGASTREARLETGDRNLAGNADELTQRVQALLGLSFEHFTKCVVLPQGEFARFLHDGHKDRMDLLEKLLDADIYQRMVQLANFRMGSAAASANECRRRLEDLAEATPQALEAARARLADLEALLASLEADQPALEALVEQRRDAQARSEAAARAAALLEKLRTPDGIAELADSVREAEEHEAATAAALTAAQHELETATDALQELPARGALEALERDRRDHQATVRQHAGAQEALDAAARDEALATDHRDAAAAALTEAVAHRDAVMRDNYAFRAAEGLQAGDLCPVCGEKLAQAPTLAPPPGHEAATRGRDDAKAALDQAEANLNRVHAQRNRREAELASLAQRVAELEQRLEGQPAAEEAADLLAKITAAEHAAQEAQQRQRSAAAAHNRARETLAALQQRRAGAWTEFDRARDVVAEFDVPDIPRQDIAAAWATLVGWARAELPLRREAAETAANEAAAALAEAQSILERQRERCEELGLVVSGGVPADLCRGALGEQRVRTQLLEENIETAVRLRRELREHEENERVARMLHSHLGAHRNAFRSWYVNQAFRRVVYRASDILEELSTGQYALNYDDGNFNVIDHTNASQLRSVRTLSGGETFLASLALALALSDNLADMAANGAARLEAIFLDEGFGSLDPDTLDIVASALEELGSRGRMVGVVTHVGALAERVPVRFEVMKDGTAGSSVKKVLV